MGTGCVMRKKTQKTPDSKEKTRSDTNNNLKLGSHLANKSDNDDKMEETDAPYAVVEDKAKTNEDVGFLKKALSNNLIFNELTEEQLDSVISHMRYYIFESEEVVFVQGTVGSVFFVVAHGRLEVLVDEKPVNELTTSDCFGEVALLHDTKRTATIKTLQSTRLWGVDRKTFRSTLDHLNANDYAENKYLITKIPSFKILTNLQLESLIHSVSISVYGPGQVIVNQGETGVHLYIIKQGSVICTKDGQQTRIMEKGDIFGEKALFSNDSLRSATVTAQEYVKCLTISRDTLTDLLGSSIQRLVHKNSAQIAFDKNSYLQKLNKTQYEKILNLLEISEKKKGEKAIQRGTEKNKQIFIVLKGALMDGGENVFFEESDILGAEEVIQDIEGCYELDYYCKDEVDIGVVSADGFLNVIEGDYQRATMNNETIKALKKIEIFRNLSEEQLESLAKVLRMNTFQKDSCVFSQGEKGDCMFLIKSGQVDVIVNGQVVRTITKNHCFGERSLLTGNIRSATAKCRSEVLCWTLFTSDFTQLFDEKLKQLLYERIELQDDRIKLTDLHPIKQLASGTYGNVFLVAHKERKTLFALKTISRNKIQGYEIQENLLHERQTLLQTDHMLINKLVKTFKDPKRLYFLCEYINGITLREVQIKLKNISLSESKFYTACVFLMLEHLHERDIIYRGLNPLNIMIDHEGYPKLIDFGTAKLIKGRTYTIVNTDHHYVAPEIISGHGYTFSSDYWSIGVMLFELLYADLPFGREDTDPYTTYESILQGKLVFPEESENKDKIKELINQLLNKSPGSRLNGGFEAIKAHPWFISINWEKLMKRSLPTSYKPLLKTVEKEVEVAKKQKRDLEQMIGSVERNEEVPKRRAYEIRVNWDDEFST